MIPAKILRTLRRFLSGSGARDPRSPTLPEAAAGAEVVIRMLYALNLYAVFELCSEWSRIAPIAAVAAPPGWPLGWIAWMGSAGVHLVFALCVLCAVACAFRVSWRWARVGAFVSFFFALAIVLRYGVELHHRRYHGFLLVLFLMTFLPSAGGASGKKRQLGAVFVVWAIQAQILLTYSLSGFWKLFYGIRSCWTGEGAGLGPAAFGVHAATRALNSADVPLLTNFVIDHPIALHPFFLMNVYFQVFSFWIAFRPALHRLWGLYLIAFHFLSLLALGVPFSFHVPLLAILFLSSPFAPKTACRSDFLHLPIFGALVRRIRPNIA